MKETIFKWLTPCFGLLGYNDAMRLSADIRNSIDRLNRSRLLIIGSIIWIWGESLIDRIIATSPRDSVFIEWHAPV